MAGTLNRDQFVTEICDVVKKAVSSLSISEAELQTRVQARYLNYGQIRIARRFSFHELNTIQESAATVDGVSRYPMISGTNNLGLTRPKDIYSIRLIDGANSRTLVRIGQRTFDDAVVLKTNFTEARPQVYTRWGNNVEMFKVPDDAYTLYIRYPQWPTNFSAAGQTSDFDNKDDLVLQAGVVETFLALQESTHANTWEGKFNRTLNEAIGAVGDTDWSPQGEAFEDSRMAGSGTPWTSPFGDEEDPLYGKEG